jgi:uncharacterized protein (TIGR02391 family)
MSDEDAKIGIARTVCLRFITRHEPTKRFLLLTEYERRDLLDQMVHRGLLRASDSRDNLLPTVGTFALLGDDDDLYQDARKAFERTASGLYTLFKDEGDEVDHSAHEFAVLINRYLHTPVTFDSVALGLYLASEFCLLQTMKVSEDRTTIERFRVSEQAIGMRDPMPSWKQRVAAAREPLHVYGNQGIPFLASPTMAQSSELTQEPFDGCGFWSLIHPAIEIVARSRFEAGHYADAVEWALKVVAEEVRTRTGLTLDGASLMNTAFSLKKPLLVFDDSIPETKASMQQGYMQIFAGTMTGIRNPKAHGMVQLDEVRCIHFLFLASLLRHKLDEATPANSGAS